MNNNILKAKFNIIDISQWAVLIGIVLGANTELLAVLFVLSILLYFKKGVIVATPKIFIGLSIVITFSIISIHVNHYQYGKFIQQAILLSIIFFGYGQIFELNKNHLDIFFERYIKIAYIVSILGFLQFLFCFLFIVDIFPFTLDGYIQKTPSLRIMPIHSIIAEAGCLGTFLVPAMAYISFKKSYFKNNKLKSTVLLVTMLLTFSAISYVMLILIFVTKILYAFKYLKYLFLAIIILLIPLLISSLKTSVENSETNNQNFISTIQRKISQTINIFELSTIEDYELLNASSYALLTNLYVAQHAPSRIIGTGLGTHSENYTKVYPPNDYYIYGLNSSDGYSLFNRVLSEFGIVGIFLFTIFIIFYSNRKNIMNISILFVIIAFLMRGGHYVLYGPSFFMFFYYYTSKLKYE